jgi:hypothetical protein
MPAYDRVSLVGILHLIMSTYLSQLSLISENRKLDIPDLLKKLGIFLIKIELSDT